MAARTPVEKIKLNKPDVPDELLAYQESYILLQILRLTNISTTRSKLNEKLKSATAREELEFPGIPPTADVTAEDKEAIQLKFKETIDYHIHNLVQAGSVTETRKRNSTSYTLTEDGLKALGAASQHQTVEFRFPGTALNTLLEAARQSSAQPYPKADHPQEKHQELHTQPTHQTPTRSHEIDPKQIHAYIAQLKADKYAGRDLIPIHEVRALVAHHHGPEAASHPVFDPLLKRMRSEGDLEIIAIADSRDTPQQHLDDSIPGMNETLFFIDTE